LEIFRNNNRLLDEIQKVLEQLLEKKRTEFARFYFVSNDELLQILADCSKHVHKIKPHLRKLFENINSVDFDLDDISKLISAEGEIIKFKKNVKTN
jgi:dynein heavy chain